MTTTSEPTSHEIGSCYLQMVHAMSFKFRGDKKEKKKN